MRPSEALALHRGRIRQIAMRHRVQDVRVFGSAVRGDDGEGSDLDLLVEPTPSPLEDLSGLVSFVFPGRCAAELRTLRMPKPGAEYMEQRRVVPLRQDPGHLAP